MKQFKLVDMRNCYEDIIAEAEEESLGYMDFLIRLLSVEDEGKRHGGWKTFWAGHTSMLHQHWGISTTASIHPWIKAGSKNSGNFISWMRKKTS